MSEPVSAPIRPAPIHPAAIRPVQPTDLATITAIYADAVQHGTASWETEPPDADEMARRCDAIRDGGFPYLVAETAGGVIAYAYASAYRPRAAYRATVENSIYVARHARGAGIGASLLSALIEACAASGFRQMVAVIGDGTGSSTASVRLHAALGFEPAGIVRAIGYKHGRWLDQVLMQRSLGDGATSPPAFAEQKA